MGDFWENLGNLFGSWMGGVGLNQGSGSGTGPAGDLGGVVGDAVGDVGSQIDSYIPNPPTGSAWGGDPFTAGYQVGQQGWDWLSGINEAWDQWAGGYPGGGGGSNFPNPGNQTPPTGGGGPGWGNFMDQFNQWNPYIPQLPNNWQSTWDSWFNQNPGMGGTNPATGVTQNQPGQGQAGMQTEGTSGVGADSGNLTTPGSAIGQWATDQAELDQALAGVDFSNADLDSFPFYSGIGHWAGDIWGGNMPGGAPQFPGYGDDFSYQDAMQQMGWDWIDFEQLIQNFGLEDFAQESSSFLGPLDNNQMNWAMWSMMQNQPGLNYGNFNTMLQNSLTSPEGMQYLLGQIFNWQNTGQQGGFAGMQAPGQYWSPGEWYADMANQGPQFNFQFDPWGDSNYALTNAWHNLNAPWGGNLGGPQWGNNLGVDPQDMWNWYYGGGPQQPYIDQFNQMNQGFGANFSPDFGGTNWGDFGLFPPYTGTNPVVGATQNQPGQGYGGLQTEGTSGVGTDSAGGTTPGYDPGMSEWATNWNQLNFGKPINEPIDVPTPEPTPNPQPGPGWGIWNNYLNQF